MDWYSANFVPGELYLDGDGRVTLQYVGVLTAHAAQGLVDRPELIEAGDANELVRVFVVVAAQPGNPTFYMHTQADADKGYSFAPLLTRQDDASEPSRACSEPPAPVD